jgi:hypothetical protein
VSSEVGGSGPADRAREGHRGERFSDSSPGPSRTTANAVLVLRALGLGDALTGIAALRGVRRAWPDRVLVLAAPSLVGDWLRGLGLVDEVLPTAGLLRLFWPPADWVDVRGHVAVNLH